MHLIALPRACQVPEPDPLAPFHTATTSIARAIDGAHHSGVLASRSGVDLERPLHPIITLLGVRGPLRVQDIAAALALPSSTVSRQVTRLIDRDLVAKTADDADGRASVIELSPDGQAAFDTLAQAWRSLFAEALEGWPPKRIARFTDDFAEFAGSFLTAALKAP